MKTIPQSIGCGKNFLGREKLTTVEQVSVCVSAYTHVYDNVHVT